MNRLTDILRDSATEPSTLSAKSGIPFDRLQALIGGAEPSLGELRRLADALKLSVTEFATPTATEHRTELLFRRASFAGTPVPTSVVTDLSRRMAYSFDLLRITKSGASEWLNRFEHGDDKLKSAERNATTFRTLFCNDDQLSPLLSLPKIAIDRMGVMLIVIRNRDLDGASAYLDGVPFVFVSAKFRGRMLFTLAHEIGHLVAHHDPSLSFAIIDETIDADELDPSRVMEERYANAFASALLLPRSSVGLALKKIREIAKVHDEQIGDLEISYLARIFGVSFWAAARRCEDLSILPRGGAASLNDELVKRYGSAEKRAEHAGLPPRPEVEFPSVPQPLLMSAIERIRAGELSVGRAAAILGLSIVDVISANAPTAH